MTTRQYTCQGCGRSFVSEWTEEEKMQEMRDLWGNLPPEEQATVCDDCFQRLLTETGRMKEA